MARYKRFRKYEIYKDGTETGIYLKGSLVETSDFDSLESCEKG